METENSRLRKGRTLKTPVANKLAQLRPQPYEEVCGVNNHAISYRLDPPRLQEPSPLASLRPSVTQKQDKWQSGDPFLTQGNLSHSCTNTNCAASDQMHKITTPKSLLATCRHVIVTGTQDRLRGRKTRAGQDVWQGGTEDGGMRLRTSACISLKKWLCIAPCLCVLLSRGHVRLASARLVSVQPVVGGRTQTCH